MITINLNGRTLRPTALKISTWSKMIKQAMAYGELEEVKENKEHPMIKCVRADLLREELEKIISDYSKRGMRDGDHMDYWVDGKVWGLKEALSLLTSLETKEEPHPYPEVQDKGREQYIADHPEELARQPQEDIELLSFDYEKLEENVRDVEFEKEQETRYIVSRIGKHLELLTSVVNQLIKANKK